MGRDVHLGRWLGVDGDLFGGQDLLGGGQRRAGGLAGFLVRDEDDRLVVVGRLVPGLRARLQRAVEAWNVLVPSEVVAGLAVFVGVVGPGTVGLCVRVGVGLVVVPGLARLALLDLLEQAGAWLRLEFPGAPAHRISFVLADQAVAQGGPVGDWRPRIVVVRRRHASRQLQLVEPFDHLEEDLEVRVVADRLPAHPPGRDQILAQDTAFDDPALDRGEVAHVVDLALLLEQRPLGVVERRVLLPFRGGEAFEPLAAVEVFERLTDRVGGVGAGRIKGQGRATDPSTLKRGHGARGARLGHVARVRDEALAVLAVVARLGDPGAGIPAVLDGTGRPARVTGTRLLLPGVMDDVLVLVAQRCAARRTAELDPPRLARAAQGWVELERGRALRTANAHVDVFPDSTIECTAPSGAEFPQVPWS